MAEEREDLVRDELERSALTGAFEKQHCAAGRRARRWQLSEERPLEMRERRRGVLAVPRGQLLHGACGERRELFRGLAQRRERRAAGLHLRPAREGGQELPLGTGQVLEAVREDGHPLPRVEVGGEAFGGVAPEQVAVPEPELVELGAVRGVEAREVAGEGLGVDERGFELGEGREEGVGEASEARGARQAVEPGPPDRAPDDERTLRIRCHGPPGVVLRREAREEVVEGSDAAGEEAAGAPEQVALDPVDVRSIRHDEIRVVVDACQVALGRYAERRSEL